LPNRKKKTISRDLKKYGAQVETVIMDMSHSFKLAVREALDRPLIIADRFHYCRYVYWALDQVRRNEQAVWSDYDRKKCKRMRRIFYKKKEELNAKERWYLNRYLQKSETLKKAYELKEAFCRWLEMAKDNGAEDILQTKEELHQFYQRVEESGIEAFQRCVRTLRNWEMEILNSFIFGYTNGFLEGINNHTKVMKRNAYGVRNIERARARILLTYKYKRIGVHVG